jgi:hypothetical protein
MTDPKTLRLQLQERRAKRSQLEEQKKREEEQRRQDHEKLQAELEALKNVLAVAESAEDAGNPGSLERNRLSAEEERQEQGLPGKS